MSPQLSPWRWDGAGAWPQGEAFTPSGGGRTWGRRGPSHPPVLSAPYLAEGCENVPPKPRLCPLRLRQRRRGLWGRRRVLHTKDSRPGTNRGGGVDSAVGASRPETVDGRQPHAHETAGRPSGSQTLVPGVAGAATALG